MDKGELFDFDSNNVVIGRLGAKRSDIGEFEIQYIRLEKNIRSVISQFRDFFNRFPSIENDFVKLACIPCACKENIQNLVFQTGIFFFFNKNAKAADNINP